MRIPEIRDRLHELADEHGVPELHELAEQYHRQVLAAAPRNHPRLNANRPRRGQ